MPIWVPNAAADAIMADMGAGEARRMLDFRQRLKALDSRLDLFLADQDSRDGEVRTGFWYVYRRNDDGTTAFWEVSNPDGTYREPDERVVEAFQMMDRDSVHDLRDRHAARRRREERRAEERRLLNEARFKDEADFAFRVQHAFPSLPWKE